MEQPQIPEPVVIEYADLQVILAALSSAYHYSMAVDLTDGYRKLNSRRSSSAMTKALQGALNITESYLVEVSTGEDDDDPS